MFMTNNTNLCTSSAIGKPMTTDVAFRLQQVRKALNLTQQELAEKVGIKQQSLQKIESGLVKRSKYIPRIAEILEVDPGWLQFGTGYAPSYLTNEQAGHTIDPRIETLVIEWEDVIDIHLNQIFPYRNEFIPYAKSKPGCFALQIPKHDDSMIDFTNREKSLLPGEFVVIDPSLTPTPFSLVIAIYEEKVILRRYVPHGKKFYLMAHNPKFPSIEIQEDNAALCAVVTASLYLFEEDQE